MKRLAAFLRAAGRLAARMRDERSTRPFRAVLSRLRARAGAQPDASSDAIPEAVPNPDGKLLEGEITTLTGLLEEIDELSASLPEDARPIGEAARSLVERSLEECRKPIVDAARVARDMQQVGALAMAMRERLLLSPQTRKTLPS